MHSEVLPVSRRDGPPQGAFANEAVNSRTRFFTVRPYHYFIHARISWPQESSAAHSEGGEELMSWKRLCRLSGIDDPGAY